MRNKTRKCLFLATALLNFWSVGLQGQLKNEMTDLLKQVTEAKKIGNVKLADSLAQLYMNGYLFKLKDQELYTKDNLTFLTYYVEDTEGKAFKLFLKAPEKVNTILGKNDIAQYALRSAIAKAYFKEIDPIKMPNYNWSPLEKVIKSKFGAIGLEGLYGRQMMYYLDAKNWDAFGRYYILYFERALKRPEYIVNELSWSGVFQHVNDPKVLNFACDVVMKYAMEEWYQTVFQAYDTYANLLYKIGRKAEAIEWETKALKAAKGTADEKLFVDVLEKMEKGIPTWSTGANN